MRKRRIKEASVVSIVLIGILIMADVALTGEAMAAEPVRIELSNPTGAIEITNLFAPRLAGLNGKTICEVSDGIWETHRTFPLIRQLLQKQFPDARIIPYTELPIGTTNIDVDGIGDVVKKKGCDAVIVGNSA